MNLKVFPAIAVALAVSLVVAACTGGDSRSRAADISATPAQETSSMSSVPTVVPFATPTSPPPEVLTTDPTSSSTEVATLIPTPNVTPIARGVQRATHNEAPALQMNRRSLAEIIESLSPSVVHIQTEAVQLDQFSRPVPGGGVGTGAIIDKKGHVLTNNHVIEGAQRILVTLSDGRAFEADLVGGDLALDLAVLRIDAKNLEPIPIGKSTKMQVGDQVVAIGHALNLPGGPTITGGWVSARNRAVNFSDTITMQHLIQTDAAINPGNSGGPLINMDGEMIGINTAKLTGGEGLGFAIAVDPVMPLIEELITQGRIDRGFLGVSTINISEALALNFDLPVTQDVGIISVAPDSPAEQAGLKTEDIIVGIGDRVVRNVAELDSILIRYQSGTSVDIYFFREDNERSVTVTLGDRPA